MVERLDDALDWLESLGAPVTERDTGNPRTVGCAIRHARADRRARARGGRRAAREPAARGRASRSCSPREASRATPARRRAHPPAAPLLLRANPWSAGDGLDSALRAGAATAAGMDEFYGREMPDGRGRGGRLRAVSRSCTAARGSRLRGRLAASSTATPAGRRPISSRRSRVGRAAARGTASRGEARRARSASGRSPT